MLQVRRSTTINVPLAAAFDYFAEFANTAAWDPGVVSSTKLTDGRLSVGDRYTVVARFGGRKLPMEYEVKAVDAPHKIVLEGRSSTSTALDEIEFEAVGAQTRITWTLSISLHGATTIAEPLVKPLVNRLARKAIEGIEHAASRGLPQQYARTHE